MTDLPPRRDTTRKGGRGLRWRAVGLLVVLVIGAAVSACDTARTVPGDLVGKHLNDAESELDAQGITYTETDGSKSAFGIVAKSNWTICATNPGAGQTVTGNLELVARHSCTDATATPLPSDAPTPDTGTQSPAPATDATAPAPADACHQDGVTYCVLNPAVTQSTIHSTICVAGWTSTVRPSESYTENLKQEQVASDGLPGGLSSYEEDHRMPLELGGAPSDSMNLSPESPRGPNPKDSDETTLKRAVCDGGMSLAQAQEQIVATWLAAYPGYRR